MSNKLNIGLFGFGCVGSGLYQVLNKSELLNAEIQKIVVKDPTKKRSLEKEKFSFDKKDILENPEINVVVELIDDAEAAFEIVTSAMRKGKHVVSANKKLIAEHLEELIEIKNECGVSFLYEAAVCGSIPIIRNLEEYYNNDSLSSIQGVCNGTSNYILTRLNNELKSFDEILKDAQDAGFAESDPTLDIDGFDSKFKLQILIHNAFGLIVRPEEVLNLGIRHVKAEDILFAKEKGLRLRLVSFAKRIEDKVVAVAAPIFVKEDSFAFDINNEFNGVEVTGLFADKQLFTGKGAGSFPTASAVLSDVSALLFGYQYEYKKAVSNRLSLAHDFEIKAFVSSKNIDELKVFNFNEIEEEFTSTGYAYKVGRINMSAFTHEFYREHPGVFISFFEDGPIILSKREKMEQETIAI
ncbi:MAG: homoserine dehydrogenase [Crocinitomicaceae bacterium]